MIIYSSTKQSFIQDFEQGVLVKKLHQSLTEKYRRVGESEIHSWQTSLSYMANVMRDFSIPDLAGVAIEYIVPNTQKRVDFIITGLDQQNKEHVVIVELKQWGEAFKVTDKKIILYRPTLAVESVKSHIPPIRRGLTVVSLKTLMKMYKLDLLSYIHVRFYITLMKVFHQNCEIQFIMEY